MDMQNVAKLNIPEGEVRTIHDKDGNLIWGRVSYGIKYKGDTAQNGTPTPSAPVAVQTVTGEQTISIDSTDYEVNLGKNLFNKNTDVLNGNYYLPGNVSSTRIVTASPSTMARTLLVRLQEGQTYTIQKKASARFRFGFTTTNNPVPNIDGVITSRLANADTSSSVTFTVPSGTPYFVCNFFSNDQAADAQNGYDAIVDSIQLEKGSTATTYAPYFTPIELCKISTYQDYIYKSGDKWYIHKETGTKQLSNVSSFIIDNGCFQTDFKYPSDKASQTLSLSSHFVFNPVQASITSNLANGEFGWNTTGYLTMKNTALTSKADWETWLSSNDPVVYYALATPTDTEITNEALVAQLEAVEQWLTRYGYNATVSGNLPIIIDRTAL